MIWVERGVALGGTGKFGSHLERRVGFVCEHQVAWVRGFKKMSAAAEAAVATELHALPLARARTIP